MRFPSFAQNGPHAGRARLGHLNKDAFILVRDHVQWRWSMGATEWRSNGALGRPGLEPGTNPESFRGCSDSASFSVSFNAKFTRCDFSLSLSLRLRARSFTMAVTCSALAATT